MLNKTMVTETDLLFLLFSYTDILKKIIIKTMINRSKQQQPTKVHYCIYNVPKTIAN